MDASVVESKCDKHSFHVINTQHDNSNQSVKIIDLIRSRTNGRERFYSMEVSHSAHLLLNFNEFPVQPLFTSVTWFEENVEHEDYSMAPAVQLINAITSTPTLLHLTCYKLTELALEKLLQMKFTNVLALRGDVVNPQQKLLHAADLVKIVKWKSDGTSLAVAGHPDLYPESVSLESDLHYLKEKVDAGADFIITQICFSSAKIIQFIAECREFGITVPIIPGIFVPSTYNALLTVCGICKIKLPEEEYRLFNLLKDKPKEFQEYAVETTVKLLNDLFANVDHPVLGVHFFTLNNFNLMKRVISNFDFQ